MNNNILDFSEQIVLITGATKGIGKSIASLFIERGAKVFITGTSQECPLELKNEWGDSFIYLHADFSTKEGIDFFLLKLKKIPRIDVCVNNAGINRLNFLEDISDHDYEIMLSVNLNAPFKICQYLSSIMKRQCYGRVVNIASIWSVLTKNKRSVYTVTKNAIVGLTKSMAIELGGYSTIVNAVSPGFTFTELTKLNLSSNEIIELSAQIPVGRFADPIDIANVVLFLCSKENTYMTGQNIIVDGGFTNV